MKNLFFFGLLIIALISVQFTQAQTVDEIVDNYVNALGGKEKLMSLKTVKLEGSMSAQGTDLTLITTKSHGVGVRLDIEVMGTSNYQVANMTKGATFWPARGNDAPEEMEPDQYKSYVNQMDLQGALCNYKEKGNAVELVGKEKVEGEDANNLKITYKNGVVVNYFIDVKTSRLVKSVSKVSMQGQEMEMSTSYSNYKQNPDGYWFPYTVTQMQGTVTYDKISTNMPVDEGIFKN